MVGSGALIHKDGKVLLVKRNNEPNKGKWALPGGLVELGERVEEAVRREVREEVGLEIHLEEMLEVVDDIHYDAGGRVKFHYILVDFLAKATGGRLRLNSESSSSKWFDPLRVRRANASENTKAVVRLFLSKSQARVYTRRDMRGRPRRPAVP
jgi:ADP-ribose pyrophosphatase YjhB (NUDIX family)